MLKIDITYDCCCLAGLAVLRQHYKSLATQLDAQPVAVQLYQRNAITLKDLQKVQSLRNVPVEAAEWLLSHVILEHTDSVFVYFLDALKETEQLHVHERLAADSYEGQCDIVCILPAAYLA